jgi:hypothetical protein
MENVFNSEVISIEYDAAINMVVMNWKPVYIKTNLYREALEMGLDIVKERGANKWLANLKQMKLISRADENWTNDIWFPKALKSSIKWMGMVVSEDVFNKSAVKKIMSNDQVKTLIVDYFTSKQDAIDWLNGKNAVAA